MVKAKLLVMVVVLALASTGLAQEQGGSAAKAQEQAERQVASYRVAYTISELDGGKVINTRSYQLVVDDGSTADMRMGLRVPANLGEKGISYMDVGLRIEARVNERSSDLARLATRFEISSLSPDQPAASGSPTTRTMEYSIPTVLTMGKPVLLVEADEPNSTHRFRLEGTVTKLH